MGRVQSPKKVVGFDELAHNYVVVETCAFEALLIIHGTSFCCSNRNRPDPLNWRCTMPWLDPVRDDGLDMYAVYQYWHGNEFFATAPDGTPFTDPLDTRQLRHACFLIVLLRFTNMAASRCIFVHKGKRSVPAEFNGNEPHWVATELHGSASGARNGDLFHASFNWAGPGHTPRTVHFVLLHRARDGGMLGLGKHAGLPWCVIRRSFGRETHAFFRWAEGWPTTKMPGRPVPQPQLAIEDIEPDMEEWCVL